MQIRANNISINYRMNGKGENLVLIHGAGDNLSMWDHQVPLFSESYRVVTYDVRGHGETESPETEYTMSLFNEDLYQFTKIMKLKNAYFLGYSMGGRLALNLAIDHPGVVKALILANSPVGFMPPEAMEGRQMTLELLEKGDFKTAVELMTASAFSPGFKDNHLAEFEKYQNIKLRNRPDCFTRMIRAIETFNTIPDLSKVQCPVLIIIGENDAIMGVDQGKLAQKAIVGSKLVILPTGHAAALELPKKFNSAVMQFLSGIGKG